MNTFITDPASDLHLRRYSPEYYGEEDTVALEKQLLATLEAAPAGGLVAVDFQDVKIASEAARQLLKRALQRIGTGEFEDRFVVLDNVARSRYSVDAMLRREGLTTVERTSAGPELIGKHDPVATATFGYVAQNPEATAKSVMDHFELQNIAAATNRLASLTKSALVRRTGPRPLATGGREYVFTAVR